MCRKDIGKDNQKMCQGLNSAPAAAESASAASPTWRCGKCNQTFSATIRSRYDRLLGRDVCAWGNSCDFGSESDSDSEADSETESKSQPTSASVAAPHFLPDPNYQPEPEEAEFKYTFATEQKSRFGSSNGWWAFYPQAELPPRFRPEVPSAQWIAAYESRVGVHDYYWPTDALADIGYVRVGDAVRVMVISGDPVEGTVREVVGAVRYINAYAHFVSADGKWCTSDVASLQVCHSRQPLIP